MKKIFLISTLTLLSITAFAQNKVRFGFTTSPGISWYNADNNRIDSKGTRFSFNYGAIVDLIIDNNDRYAITTGLTIDMNGGKLKGIPEEGSTISGSSSLTTKVQYLEIPVGLKLRSNETAKNLTYYGTLGLINGFRIRSRGKYEFASNEAGVSSISEKNIKIKNLRTFPTDIKKVNPYQLALHFEAGVEYRVSDNTSVVGGLYFRNGFTNVIDDNDHERVVARGLGLRIAVMF